MLRLALMGIGLGVITGSALKLMAPQVQQQQLVLPEWLTDQDWIKALSSSSQSGEEAEITTTQQESRNKELTQESTFSRSSDEKKRPRTNFTAFVQDFTYPYTWKYKCISK